MATWQSTSFEINPGAYYEMSILTGKANIFMATNANSEDVYIGLGSIPRLDHYEKILKRNTTDVFGRPTTVSRVYFYNPSSTKIGLTVWYSYDDDFDYGLLKSMTMNLEGAALDAIKFDGIIQGFKSGIKLDVYDNTAATRLNTIRAVNEDIKIYAGEIKRLLEEKATTNETILEGINAILATL